MTTEWQVLLRLCRGLAEKQAPALDDLPQPDWEEVFRLASSAKMVALLYDSVAALSGEWAVPSEVMTNWKASAFALTLRQMAADAQAEQLLRGFVEGQLGYAVMKGPILAALYEAPQKRQAADLDILVDLASGEQAEALLAQGGFVMTETTDQGNVQTWIAPRGLKVELHRRLWEEYSDQRIARMEQMGVGSPEYRTDFSFRSLTVTTLAPLQHLVFLIYHIIKHVTFQGINLRNLLDTALFVNAYLDQLDVEAFWQTMAAVRYDQFCMAMFSACVRFLGMDERALGGHARRTQAEDEQFLADLMRLYGKAPQDQLHKVASAAVFSAYHKEGQNNAGARWQLLLSTVFPKSAQLSGHYAYARRYPILLPAAWVHRAFRNVALRLRKEKPDQDVSVKQSLLLAEEKLEMLRDYDLIN